MRQLIAALAVATMGVLAAGCSTSNPGTPASTTTSTSTPSSAPPVAPAALDGLLLSPDAVNNAMDATGMTVSETSTTTFDDSAHVADKDCLAIYAPAEDAVYANSGYTAVRVPRTP